MAELMLDLYNTTRLLHWQRLGGSNKVQDGCVDRWQYTPPPPSSPLVARIMVRDEYIQRAD